MGNRKGLDFEIFEQEATAGFKMRPACALLGGMGDRTVRITVADPGEVGLFAQTPKPLTMVGVFVGEEDRIDIHDGETLLGQHFTDSPAGKSGIDENPGMRRGQQAAVTCTARTQDAKVEGCTHGRRVRPAGRPAHKKRFDRGLMGRV